MKRKSNYFILFDKRQVVIITKR